MPLTPIVSGASVDSRNWSNILFRADLFGALPDEESFLECDELKYLRELLETLSNISQVISTTVAAVNSGGVAEKRKEAWKQKPMGRRNQEPFLFE